MFKPTSNLPRGDILIKVEQSKVNKKCNVFIYLKFFSVGDEDTSKTKTTKSPFQL